MNWGRRHCEQSEAITSQHAVIANEVKQSPHHRLTDSVLKGTKQS